MFGESARPFAHHRRLLEPLQPMLDDGSSALVGSRRRTQHHQQPTQYDGISRIPADIRIDEMAAELSRCDKDGALDICCRELREDMVATRERLREVDRKLRDLIKRHDELGCGAHETRVRATMVTPRRSPSHAKTMRRPTVPVFSLDSSATKTAAPNKTPNRTHATTLTEVHARKHTHTNIRTRKHMSTHANVTTKALQSKDRKDGVLSRLLARLVDRT